MNDNYKFWKGEKITSMTGNNIFVYGANPEFRNGAGAAKAARAFGAKPYGSGRGIVGNTYGLITKNLKPGFIEKETGIKYEKSGPRSVSPEQIRANIDELYECARNNPEKKFFIGYTYDNKNLNGYTSEEMWDMFTHNKEVPENIRFHESFKLLAKKAISQKKEENDKKYTFFWLTPSPFSQWHPSIFKVKEVSFTSSEQFMMYCKAKLFNDEEVADKIINLNQEGILKSFLNGEIEKESIFNNKENLIEWNYFQNTIKKLGRKVKNYKEEVWVQHRFNYVKVGNLNKFNQNEDLKKELLNTKDTLMVEASPYDKESTNYIVVQSLIQLKEHFKNNNINSKKNNKFGKYK